jgi:hypothetical protein
MYLQVAPGGVGLHWRSDTGKPGDRTIIICIATGQLHHITQLHHRLSYHFSSAFTSSPDLTIFFFQLKK